MSVRLYVGNLPESFETQELEGLLRSVAAGVRFKPVSDRESGLCRGFGFADVDDAGQAEALIGQLNGREFGGNSLRIEISERPGTRTGERRGPQGAAALPRRAINKVVHTDSVDQESPDPRWAGELAKLKSLLANQTAAV